ncbi:hypothetical protein PQR29_19870 [Paraburkholderia strydomiana]|uniref:hypothetical protein n=1 Tax=Paraburkholderia strydomiana TaxID=1245417 RepID=UPI0038B9278F
MPVYPVTIGVIAFVERTIDGAMGNMASRRIRAGDKKTARRPLTKDKLLPMNGATAGERSLSYYLALDCWRRGHGNGRLVNQLIRATYLAWFVQRAGFGDVPVELFRTAECIAEITRLNAHESGQDGGWSLDEGSVSTFTAILALHDAQLRTAPLHHFEKAERHLLAFLQGTERSPIPDPVD